MTKMLICQSRVIALLLLAYAKSMFSHNKAHMCNGASLDIQTALQHMF